VATKRKTQGVSLQPELLERAKARAGDKGWSDYVVSLIERDLSGATETPVATSPTILIDLCRTLRPDIVDDLAQHLEELKLSQPALLARLLEQLSESLDDRASYGEKGEHWPTGSRPRVIVKFLPESARSLKTEVTYPEKPGSSSMVSLKTTTNFNHTLYRITAQGLVEEQVESTEPPQQKLSSPHSAKTQPEASQGLASLESQKRRREP
jgi:hypothetical protein